MQAEHATKALHAAEFLISNLRALLGSLPGDEERTPATMLAEAQLLHLIRKAADIRDAMEGVQA